MRNMKSMTTSCSRWATSLACLVGASIPLAAAFDQATSKIQRVKSLDELRSGDAVQRARAGQFPFQGNRLIDLKTISVVAEPEDQRILLPGATPPTQADLLGEMLCGTPAVLLGRVRDAKAFLNEPETFLYTDHHVEVERWIRPSTGREQVTLSAMGGRVLVGEVLLDAAWGPRYEVGKRYVMFLREIPGGDGYRQIHYPFDAAKGYVLSSSLSSVGTLKNTEESFLRDVTAFTQRCARD